MRETHYRQPALIFVCLFITSLATVLMASGISLGAGEDVDTTQVKEKEKLAAEIEISDEGITVRAADEDKAKPSKGIVISEEGILLNGEIIAAEDLDTAMRCLAEGGSIVRFGEDITVEENECVDGDLVAIGANITVRGLVTGDVAVIGGNLYLKSTGIIKGDIHTVGGTLHQEPGSEIRGQRVGVLPMNFEFFKPHVFIVRPFTRFVGYGISIVAIVIISLILVALAAFFAPQHVTRIQETIERAPVKSILLGFAANIFFLPLFVLLCVTIIGIPIAFIVQPIAYFVASIMGFAGVSLFVGTKIHRGSSLTLATPMAKIIVGAVAIELVLILAWFLTLGGSVLVPLFWLFQLIGLIIISVAGMAGLGAAAWTRFGLRSVIPGSVPVPQTSAAPSQEHGEDEETPASG